MNAKTTRIETSIISIQHDDLGNELDVRCTSHADKRRKDAADRAHACRVLGCPIDSCYTTGEMWRDVRLGR
jgi:hypothetical protein